MPLRSHNQPNALVLSWDEPAVFPGDVVEVSDEQAERLDSEIWFEPVADKNASNQSGGSLDEAVETKSTKKTKEASEDATAEPQSPATDAPEAQEA